MPPETLLEPDISLQRKTIIHTSIAPSIVCIHQLLNTSSPVLVAIPDILIQFCDFKHPFRHN